MSYMIMGKITDILYNIFQGVIVLPLTAGNITYTRNNKTCHDGRISTMAIVCCVVAVILVVILVQVSQQDTNNHKISNVLINILLTILVVIGLLSMIIVFIQGCRNRSEIVVRVNSPREKSGLKMKFLWFFGLACIVYSSFSIGLFADCLDDYPQFNQRYEGNIIYNVILIIFYFVQMTFISYFSKWQFQGSVSGHYFILFILAANIAIWFHSFLNNSLELFEMPNKNYTDTNSSTWDDIVMFPCNINSPFGEFIARLEPFLYPGIVAYSLVAVGFVMGMWTSTNQGQIENDGVEPDEEETALLKERSDRNNSLMSVNRINNRSPISFYVAVLLGSIAILPLIIGVAILVFIKNGDVRIYLVWLSYKFAFKVSLLLLNMVAFYKLSKECRPSTSPKSLTGNEWILLISTYVDTIFHTFELLAGVLSTEDHILSQLVFSESIFNLLTDYFQTVFILQAHRYEKRFFHDSVWPIENICFLLFLMNFGRWIVGSFYEIRFPSTTIVPEKFYGHQFWYHVMHIVFPVVIFYRFRCSLDHYSIYYSFKH